MKFRSSAEFSYSSAADLPIFDRPFDGGYSPRTGDFSIKSPPKTFLSSVELELLTSKECRAYQMRWGMKGHPKLNTFIAGELHCLESEVPGHMERISLKVRFFNRLSLN